MNKEQVQVLVNDMSAARDAYYKHNLPIMGDQQYDAMEKQLREVVKQHPEYAELAASLLQQVGSDITSTARVPHRFPMLSIENQYTEEDLITWFNSLPPNTKVCVEPKFDGISVSLTYMNGYLARALTRGTGSEGEDITAQMKATGAVPPFLNPDKFSGGVTSSGEPLEIRGELVMKNSTLERINKDAVALGWKQYTSTRNLTGGTMKLKDLSLIANREIMFMAWDVLGHQMLPDSGLERLRLISEVGFLPPLANIVSDSESLINTLHQRLRDRETILKNTMSLETDGVVIKVDSHKLRRKLGVASKYTNYQTCFKPQSATGTTYLRGITWQVGRTGKISPVGNCDAVMLAGASVTNATLNNITYIQKMGLKIGAKIEMLRSGDVIPQIVRVLDEGDMEITPPANCPECQHLLIASDEGGEGIIQHFCVNQRCPAILGATLAFIGSREVLEVDGLGPEMARRLVVNGIFDIAELYIKHTVWQKQVEKIGGHRFMEEEMRAQGYDLNLIKMLLSLEKAKTASWERWIKAMCIPMIGNTLGKTIAMKLDLQADDMKVLPEKLLYFTTQEVEGFGDAKRDAISLWINGPSMMQPRYASCRMLYELGIRPTPLEQPKVVAGAPLKGIAFCITGDFSEDREQIIKKLVSLGAVSKSGVTSKINLLIVGDNAGKSKLDKANKLGNIRQEGREWLQKTLTENGLTFAADFAEKL